MNVFFFYLLFDMLSGFWFKLCVEEEESGVIDGFCLLIISFEYWFIYWVIII